VGFIPEGGCLGYPGMNVGKRRHAILLYVSTLYDKTSILYGLRRPVAAPAALPSRISEPRTYLVLPRSVSYIYIYIHLVSMFHCVYNSCIPIRIIHQALRARRFALRAQRDSRLPMPSLRPYIHILPNIDITHITNHK